jgi:hypothetical protein
MNRRPSAPLVISLVALFFSLSGAGFAAQHYLGPAHASAGSTINVYGKPVTMCAAHAVFAKCEVGFSGALCPPGTVVTGGGWVGVHGDYALDAGVTISGPQKNFAWNVEMDNHSRTADSFRAVAVCSS